MEVALAVERAANGADAAIHHVRRRLYVGAGFGLHDRLLDQRLDRFVVLHVAIAHDAVMAVAVEGIERHVADDAHVGDRLFDRPDGAADEIVRIVGLTGVWRFGLRIRLGKDRDGGNAEVARRLGGFDEEIDAETVDAGHGGDRRALVLPLLHEYRPDQVVNRKLGFGDEAAGPILATVAAQPRRRIATEGRKAFRHGGFL